MWWAASDVAVGSKRDAVVHGGASPTGRRREWWATGREGGEVGWGAGTRVAGWGVGQGGGPHLRPGSSSGKSGGGGRGERNAGSLTTKGGGGLCHHHYRRGWPGSQVRPVFTSRRRPERSCVLALAALRAFHKTCSTLCVPSDTHGLEEHPGMCSPAESAHSNRQDVCTARSAHPNGHGFNPDHLEQEHVTLCYEYTCMYVALGKRRHRHSGGGRRGSRPVNK